MNSEEELQELEKKLYAAADKMRGAVPVSSYKFIILGLIFLKYIYLMHLKKDIAN